jgi:hypothetical protein
MPNRKLQELPDVSDFDASSLLHTKEQSDNSDRKVQVQGILDLITIPDSVPTPDDGIVPANDLVVWSDVTDAGGQLKAATFEAFRMALGTPNLTGDVTNGYYNIGPFQVRWGSEISTTDSEESFNFSVPFTAQCFGVWVTRNQSNLGTVMEAATKTQAGFTINRNDGIDGNQNFDYFAIGR